MKTEVVHTLTNNFEAAIADHFVDVNKMVALGSGSQREVDDIMLTNNRFSRFPGVRP
jgi:hypothetical protein